MNFIKFFLMTMVFVVTGTNVMAMEPDELGDGPVSRRSYEIMKQREKAELARAIGAARPVITDEQNFGKVLLQKLIDAAGESELSGLFGTSAVRLKGLRDDNFDVSTLASLGDGALSALIIGMIEMNDALSDKALLGSQLEKEKVALTAEISRAKAEAAKITKAKAEAAAKAKSRPMVTAAASTKPASRPFGAPAASPLADNEEGMPLFDWDD